MRKNFDSPTKSSGALNWSRVQPQSADKKALKLLLSLAEINTGTRIQYVYITFYRHKRYS
jgi:hypothetical protein